MGDVTITYLQMTDRGQLRPRPTADPRFTVSEATVRQWRVNRFLYECVGADYRWHDKQAWSDEQWRAYVEDESLRTFIASWGGSPAGYFELASRDGAVELAYFGLLPAFTGRGLGAALLTRALEEAWAMGPSRVWVHTCTLDHPGALPNYLARGMVPYKTERTGLHPPSAEHAP